MAPGWRRLRVGVCWLRFTREAPRSCFGVCGLVGFCRCVLLRSWGAGAFPRTLLTHPQGGCLPRETWRPRTRLGDAMSHQLGWHRVRAHGGCPEPQPAKAQRGPQSPSARVLSSSPAVTSSGGCLTPSSLQRVQPPPDLFLLSRLLTAAGVPRSAAVALPSRCGTAACRRRLASPMDANHDGCSAQPSQRRKSPFGSSVM